MKLSCPDFQEGGPIPARFTCDGADVSPGLEWSEPPAGTRSLALRCDDPDAPVGNWVHWLIFNIPPTSLRLAENQPKQKVLGNGSRQGMNDFRNVGYGGPCPPRGTHRYVFRIAALDTMLDLAAGASEAQLLAAMQGHVLAEAELTGRYGR